MLTPVITNLPSINDSTSLKAWMMPSIGDEKNRQPHHPLVADCRDLYFRPILQHVDHRSDGRFRKINMPKRFVRLIDPVSGSRFDLRQGFLDPAQLFTGQTVQDAVPKPLPRNRLNLHLNESPSGDVADA